MSQEKFTDIRSLLTAFAKAMNLINPEIENHHQQAAYLAYMLTRQIGMNERDMQLSVYAALLHDIGTVMLEQPVTIAQLEVQARKISLSGAEMLSDISGMYEISEVIRYCQCSWQEIVSIPDGKQKFLQIASAVHLADTVSTLLKPEIPVLQQRNEIVRLITSLQETEFSPEAVKAFAEISKVEFIWLDLLYHPSFLLVFTGEMGDISLDRTVELTKLLSRVIDYRSAFTAMHSAGVAASAVRLAQLAGMSEEECKMMRIAGNLHDIGKLKVPTEILEKPAKLTDDEFSIIKEHSYFTRLILIGVKGFEKLPTGLVCIMKN